MSCVNVVRALIICFLLQCIAKCSTAVKYAVSHEKQSEYLCTQLLWMQVEVKMKETCRYVVAPRQQDPVLRQQGTTTTQREELILGVLVNVMRALFISVPTHPLLPSHAFCECLCAT